MSNYIRVAIAGNPNAGKTSIFNGLTGSSQAVGNWPGVTVEKKTGKICFLGNDIELVDLPGTYSLSAYSDEEVISRNYLVKKKPDVVINVVDATALEHSLFLTLQLVELGLPMVIALNMSDEAMKAGIKIDTQKLSKVLGVPVVPTVGTSSRQGLKELLEQVIKVAFERKVPKYKVDYGAEIERSTKQIEGLLVAPEVAKTSYNVHFFAHKILENDSEIAKELEQIVHDEAIHNKVGAEVARLKAIYGDDIETLVADRRYAAANGLAKLVVTGSYEERRRVSDLIDLLLTNRFVGVIIFLGILWGVFQLTYLIGNPIGEWIGFGLSKLGEIVSSWLSNVPFLGQMLSGGVIEGVGGVLVFFPNIFILFVFLSLLEDSGYMARVAFVMDGIMSKIGLSGKAFVPFVIGFGCSVPAIMATRTLDSKRERIITMLTAPLVSCSARMEVLVFLSSIFFAKAAGSVVWAVFAFGILMAIVMAKIFSATFFKGQPAAPLLIELPHYRVPTMLSVLLHTWERSKHFIKRAFGIIFVGSLVFWLLSNIPFGVGIEHSIIGRIGHSLEFLVLPLGLDWRAVVALLFGFVAKEVLIPVFSQLDPSAGSSSMQSWYAPSSALGMLIFFNMYTPCLATIAAIKAEAGTRWALFSVAYGLALGWIMAFLANLIGNLFM